MKPHPTSILAKSVDDIGKACRFYGVKGSHDGGQEQIFGISALGHQHVSHWQSENDRFSKFLYSVRDDFINGNSSLCQMRSLGPLK